MSMDACIMCVYTHVYRCALYVCTCVYVCTFCGTFQVRPFVLPELFQDNFCGSGVAVGWEGGREGRSGGGCESEGRKEEEKKPSKRKVVPH